MVQFEFQTLQPGDHFRLSELGTTYMVSLYTFDPTPEDTVMCGAFPVMYTDLTLLHGSISPYRLIWKM